MSRESKEKHSQNIISSRACVYLTLSFSLNHIHRHAAPLPRTHLPEPFWHGVIVSQRHNIRHSSIFEAVLPVKIDCLHCKCIAFAFPPKLTSSYKIYIYWLNQLHFIRAHAGASWIFETVFTMLNWGDCHEIAFLFSLSRKYFRRHE